MPKAGVSVVIATRGRPALLRRAIRSIVAQRINVPIEVIVVFDGVELDEISDVDRPARVTLTTILNAKSPGLAGARNTGIERAQFDLVAFCDDDDEWLPGKLDRQLSVLDEDSTAIIVATGIRIESEGGSHVRLSPRTTGLADLLESRITELHPSSFLIRRSDLTGELGGIDERIPASYGEDYDLLLRAAKMGHIAAVPDPLVVVHWDRASFFSEKWEGISGGLSYLLDKHPEFCTSPKGAARIQGQIAFAYAALGERRSARAWAARALRNDVRQLRGYAAYAIAARLLPAAAVVGAINRRGVGL